MIRVGTLTPQSLRVETEPYSHGWEMIKNSDGDAVDRDIRQADWNFFFLAANIQATAWGHWGERNARKAMKKVLAQVKQLKFTNGSGIQVTVSGVSALSLRPFEPADCH